MRDETTDDPGSPVRSGATRREVLLGAVSTVVAGSLTPAAAVLAAEGPARWTVTTTSDPVFAGRMIFAVDLRGKGAVLVLPETCFGERAKGTLTELIDPAAAQPIRAYRDLRLTLHGGEWARRDGAPADPLEWRFTFRHRATASKDGTVVTNPFVAIEARGLSLGRRRWTPMASVDPETLAESGDAGIPTVLSGSVVADLLRTIFGNRLVQPEDIRSIRLSLRLPGYNGQTATPLRRPLILCATVPDGAVDKALFAIGVRAQASHRTAGRPLVVASRVDFWREVPEPARPGDRTKPGDEGFDAKKGLPSQAATIANFVEPSISRPTGPARVELGRTSLVDRGSAVVVDLSAIPERARESVRIARTDQSEPTGLVREAGIRTTLAVAGSLRVVTRRGGGTDREEGPFVLDELDLTISGDPDGKLVEVVGVLNSRDALIDVSTAFGPMLVSRAEPRRDDPRPDKSKAPGTIIVRNGLISDFQLTARVESLAIPLADDLVRSPASREESARSHRADLFFPGGQQVQFRLNGLTDAANRRPRLGAVALGWTSGATSSGAGLVEPFSLPLEAATLRLLRWSDLLSLTYRFAGLDLAMRDGVPHLAPRGLASAARLRPGSGGETDAGPALPQPGVDPRPMMVVEFPPQHVAEEAFYEQRKERPPLPDYPIRQLTALRSRALDESSMTESEPNAKILPDPLNALGQLRRTYPEAGAVIDGDKAELRLSTRRQLIELARELKKIAVEGSDEQKIIQAYIDFQDKFEKTTAAMPAEQKLYVGSEFLDPAARLEAERLAAKPGPHPLPDILFSLPEDPVPPDERAGMEKAGKTAADVDQMRKQRNPFFGRFREAYVNLKNRPRFSSEKDRELDTFAGRTELFEALKGIRGSADKEFEQTLVNFQVWVTLAIRKADPGQPSDTETPRRRSRARLSGPTRLAFRLNTDDYELAEPNAWNATDAAGLAGGTIKLTAAALTNWSRHELAVVRRAEKLFKSYGDGSRRPAWDREEETDLALQLLHQGLSRGGWDDTTDPFKTVLAAYSKTGRSWPRAFVSAETRLAEVAGLSKDPPGLLETSIELPFRLHLSPSQDGRFRTRRRTPDWARADSGPADTLGTERVDPLWTAELEPGSALRAVWSPDYRPEAFLPPADVCAPEDPNCANPLILRPEAPPANSPPVRGPYAPWSLDRSLDQDRLIKTEQRPPTFRTSLDAYDRHELVVLSSVHGLPVLGRVTETGSRIGADQFEPPTGFQVSTGRWPNGVEPMGSTPAWLLNDIYVPRPLSSDGLELGLSSLGGFLRVDAGFDPPTALLDGQGKSYFTSSTVERWRHRIVLGRDVAAEVVYKGYLFPLGIRCSLIKITERRFEKVEGRIGPVAVLRQRMLLRIGKPRKDYPAQRQADFSRRLCFRSVEIQTRVTPDLVDPFLVDQNPEGQVMRGGLIDLSVVAAGESSAPSRGVAFWPRTARRQGAEVGFDLLLDGTVPTRCPLIFVDNAAATDATTIRRLTHYYNEVAVNRPELVTADIRGAKLQYAPPRSEGDTSFETRNFVFAAEGYQPSKKPIAADYDPRGYNNLFATDAALQGADQPPFYPAMRSAVIVVGQTERLTGQKANPVRVTFDRNYAVSGFPEPDKSDSMHPNPNEVFLALVDPMKLDFGSSADRGGGVGRGQMLFRGLSRRHGPIGDNTASTDGPTAAPPSNLPPTEPAPVATGQITSTSFFDKDAKLLGLVTFWDVIKALVGAEPALKEITEYAGGVAGQADDEVRSAVIRPMREVLDSLSIELEQQLPGGNVTGRDMLVRIYPAVATSFDALKNVLERLLASPSAGSDAVGTVEIYTEVYAAGRSFVNALAQAAEDPVTPVRAEVRRQFDKIFETFRAQLFDSELVQQLTGALELLRGADMRRGVAAAVRDKLLRPVIADVFAVSGTAKFAETRAAARAALDEALGDDFVTDPGARVWPGVNTNGKPIFDPKAFLTATAEILKLKSATVAAGARKEVEDLAEALAAKAAAIAGSALADIDSSLRGWLFDVASTALDGLNTAVAGLSADVTDVVEKFKSFGVVNEAATAIAKAAATVEGIATTLAKAGTTVCTDLADALNTFVTTCIPKTLVANSGTAELRSAVLRMQDAVPGLTGRLDAIVAYIEDPKNGLDKNLASPIRSISTKLTYFANAVGNGARSLVGAVDDLATKVDALHTLTGGLGARCTDPSGLLDEVGKVVAAVAPVLDLRVALLGALKEAAGLTAKLLNDIAVGATKKPKTTKPATGYAADPLGDPALWAWDAVKPGTANEVRWLLIRIEKDVAGLASQIAHGLVGATANASVLTALTDRPALPLAIPAGYKQMNGATARSTFKRIGDAVNGAGAATTSLEGKIGAVLGTISSYLDPSSSTNPLVAASEQLRTTLAWASQLVTNVENVLTTSDRLIADAADTFDQAGQVLAAELGARLDDIRDRVLGATAEAEATIVRPIQDGQEALERRIVSTALAVMRIARNVVDGLEADLVRNLEPSIVAAVEALDELFAAAVEARARAVAAIDDITKGFPVSTLPDRIRAALFAYPPVKPEGVADALANQSARFSAIRNGIQNADKAVAAADLLAVIRSWSGRIYDDTVTFGPNPIVLIAENVAATVDEIGREFARGDFSGLIDFAAVRRLIEARLRGLVPSRVTMAYDLDVPLQPVLENVFEPATDSRLTLKSRAVFDLLNGGSPSFESSGVLGPFKLNLFGESFDICTLTFDGARFGSITGGKFECNVTDVKLGQMVSFLESVSSFFSFGSNGFYVRALFGPPGIEAGYKMPPSGFALGVLGVQNLSLLASAILPFDGSTAMFKVGLSEPETPFSINIGVYGGEGHLSLYASPAEIVGFEASFTFGAVVSFQLGPLVGRGSVTTGVFIRSFRAADGRTITTIEGIVRASGSARLAMFHVSALLEVRVGQTASGSLRGTAIFAFSFSMGFRDITYRITTTKTWKKGFGAGDPGISGSLQGREILVADSRGGVVTDASLSAKPDGRLVRRNITICKGENYRAYRTYFEPKAPWRPEI